VTPCSLVQIFQSFEERAAPIFTVNVSAFVETAMYIVDADSHFVELTFFGACLVPPGYSGMLGSVDW
jgi:hypothetical protein